MITCHLKERAFLAMVFSSIEVYKHETLGLLLGFKGENSFAIEYAIPYQTAVKGYSWVSPKPQAAEKMTKVLENMAIDVIGDYHSHTQYGEDRATTRPSGDDIADMEKGKLYITVAVNDKTRKKRWITKKNGNIRGTIGDYDVELGAVVAYGNHRYKRVKIICPSATGLGY